MLMLPKPVKAAKAAPSPIPRRSRLQCGKPPARSKRVRIKTRRPLGTKRMEAKAAGYVDPLTWEAVVRYYHGLCAYCETRLWAERDHVYPISKGGPDVIENLVPSCPPCNAKKGQSTRWSPVRVHPYVTRRGE